MTQPVAPALAAVRAAIDAATAAAGRPAGSVRLLAATKTQPVARVVEAVAAGQLLLGENRAQELRDKAEPEGAACAAVGLPAPEWHFIGPLQSNKVKYVVGRATVVHSLDGLEIAAALDARVAALGLPPLGVLVQVNVGGEGQKSGVAPGEALAFCAAVQRLPGLRLAGLMTVPPATEDPAAAAPHFAALAALAAEGRAAGLPLHELSMGMSHDLAVAIAHGATIIRVGTALFGARSAPAP